MKSRSCCAVALLSLAFVVLAACSTVGKRSGASTLKLEQIYQSTDQDQFTGETVYNYLMFYADGSVIGVCSIGTPEQVRPWFTIATPELGKGKYHFSGDHLSFSLSFEEGVIEYSGVLQGDAISFAVTSRINDHRSNQMYSLVSIDAEQRAQRTRPKQRASERGR